MNVELIKLMLSFSIPAGIATKTKPRSLIDQIVNVQPMRNAETDFYLPLKFVSKNSFDWKKEGF